MRMRIRVIVGLAGAVAILAFASGATAITAPGFTELISVSSAGVQGNQDSERPAMSADGRFVAFGSLSDNLVPGDTNASSDIFVRDRMLGTTERVSVSSAGREGDAHSGLFDGMSGPSISADGRFVVFDSEATNLVKGDTNGVSDVFIHDRVTGTTERVSVSSTGAQASGTDGTISADGKRVAFTSFSDNLVPGDTNFSGDVFVRDLAAGTTVRVSVATDGSQGNNSSSHPSLDSDGHVVAFDSAADLVPNDGNGTVDVYVHDLDTGRQHQRDRPLRRLRHGRERRDLHARGPGQRRRHADLQRGDARRRFVRDRDDRRHAEPARHADADGERVRQSARPEPCRQQRDRHDDGHPLRRVIEWGRRAAPTRGRQRDAEAGRRYQVPLCSFVQDRYRLIGETPPRKVRDEFTHAACPPDVEVRPARAARAAGPVGLAVARNA